MCYCIVVRITQRDVLSLANGVTIVGLLLTAYGSLRLNTWTGFVCTTCGRVLDILDGPIARRTHTSRFGAVLDATVDKITVLFIALGLLSFNVAPRWIVLFILLYHGAIAAMNIIAASRKIIVTTTSAGKLCIFLQMTAMLMFVGATQLPWRPGLIINSLAYICFVASLPYALHSLRDYRQTQKAP